MEKSHVEAWKSVIEFSKVIISLAASILTLIIGYITLNNIHLSFVNMIPPFLLILAIFFSLIGFGRAIPAIKNGEQSRISVLFSNLSVFVLIIAILSMPIISVKNKSLNEVLKIIESETKTLAFNLKVKTCKEIKVIDDIYVLTYLINEKSIIAKYSTKSNKIIFVGEKE